MLKQLLGLAAYVLLFAILLFVPAGTTEWPAAWILLVALVKARGVSLLRLWPTQRRLLEERSALPQAGVVDTGPYATVRHPMYSGLLFVMVGLSLWLGSLAGAIAALVPAALLTLRIVVEERTLRNSLPGYGPYADRVRARLLPRVW